MTSPPARGEARLREEIVAAARRMNAIGLNQGTSGNLSLRLGDGLLITPSGLDYDLMQPEDVVFLAMDGTWQAASGRRPSSEWRIHRDILLARSEVAAVLHAHSPFCTSLACLRREIPAFHYMIAIAGGDSIRCAPYATFGTQALSELALAALDDRRACLLANHGMIALGGSLDQALAIAVEVETLARQYCQALQLGEPVLLNAEEMERVLERFEAYRAGRALEA